MEKLDRLPNWAKFWLAFAVGAAGGSYTIGMDVELSYCWFLFFAALTGIALIVKSRPRFGFGLIFGALLPILAEFLVVLFFFGCHSGRPTC